MTTILSTPKDFREVIDLWGKRSALGREIRAPRGTVQQWHTRNSIPPIWIPKVAAAAKIRGLPVREDDLWILANQVHGHTDSSSDSESADR
jgi:hypothetical protein